MEIIKSYQNNKISTPSSLASKTCPDGSQPDANGNYPPTGSSSSGGGNTPPSTNNAGVGGGC